MIAKNASKTGLFARVRIPYAPPDEKSRFSGFFLVFGAFFRVLEAAEKAFCKNNFTDYVPFFTSFSDEFSDAGAWERGS